MDPTVTVAVIGSFGVIVGGIIAAATTVSLNRSTASKMLSEAQLVAQKTALESADHRYSGLRSDYARVNRRLGECETKVMGMKRSIRPVLDAFVTLISRAEPINGHEVNITVTRVELNKINTNIVNAYSHTE